MVARVSGSVGSLVSGPSRNSLPSRLGGLFGPGTFPDLPGLPARSLSRNGDLPGNPTLLGSVAHPDRGTLSDPIAFPARCLSRNGDLPGNPTLPGSVAHPDRGTFPDCLGLSAWSLLPK